MTATRWVQAHGAGFWAYDVALAVFLDELIQAADEHEPVEVWLRDAVDEWRLVKAINDYGLRVPTMSSTQKETFVTLIERACMRVAEHEVLTGADLEARGVFPRGAMGMRTAPIVELGRAIAELVRGALPPPPAGKAWFYGAPDGRTTLAMRAP